MALPPHCSFFRFYCKPLPLGVSKAGSSSRGEDIFVDFRSAVTGDRWLTGDADLEGDFEYDVNYQKAGLQKTKKFVQQGNEIGIE